MTVCATVLTLAGCTLRVTPAQGERAASVEGAGVRLETLQSGRLSWPLRSTDNLPMFRGQNVFEQYVKAGKSARRGTGALYTYTVDIDETQRVSVALQARCAVIGNAWVRWFGRDYPNAPVEAGSSENSGLLGVDETVEVCTWATPAPGELSAKLEREDDGEWFVNTEKLAASAGFSQELGLLVPPLPPKQKVRGLAIVLSPLSERDLLGPVHQELASRGWAILVQRRITFNLPVKEGGAHSTGNEPVEIDERAEAMGLTIDRNLADQAYAIEAALAHFRRLRPDVLREDTPIVLMGFSLGAIVGPTTAARLGNNLHAAVFVGGGALAGPVLVSSGVFRKSDGTPTIRVPEREMPVWELDYLASTRLDPYHTAPLLTRLPVLQVDGASDGTVKPRYADLLWERLGRPERWTTSGGHTWLFLSMDTLAPRMLDWVERTIPRPGAATMLSP